MKTRKKSRIQMFIMADVIAAMALLLILGVAFSISLRVLGKMSHNVSEDRRGIAVVDNTLERLGATPDASAARIQQIFQEEFTASGLESRKAFKPEFAYSGGKAHLELKRPNGKPLIAVELECAP
ncbi:MAG: hypothetical protein JXR78_02480 [Victivallales bacterium]|nr:hypothetical protein [Victivallales bacterium]